MAATAEPNPERAQRTTVRVLWASAALTVFVGVFLVADVTKSADSYGPAAWLGVVLAALAILALTALYVACALGRVTLGKVVGPASLFQLSAICLVIAVGADILIPDRDTGGLALLLPWGITYWLHNLNRPPAD
jgi:cytochrome bd-type quinol oxidase subunit 2